MSKAIKPLIVDSVDATVIRAHLAASQWPAVVQIVEAAAAPKETSKIEATLNALISDQRGGKGGGGDGHDSLKVATRKRSGNAVRRLMAS